jgi:hypothetical protein
MRERRRAAHVLLTRINRTRSLRGSERDVAHEFLKEHRTVQEQQAIIAQLKSAVYKQAATAAQQQKQIETLSAGLQKVSTQLELSRFPLQTTAKSQ